MGDGGPRDARYRRALDELHSKDYNFEWDPDEVTEHNGWRVDDYRQRLPSEAPGRPLPDGVWQLARRLVENYEFADPSIVRAVYYPDRPLEDRDILLEARFLWIRFLFGCRVGRVKDEETVTEAGTIHVWGWSYRTLQGHLEMGQMDYEIWKWAGSGEVEFRIHVVSKAARIPNLVIRLGFRIFGRPMQILFARRACTRMATLVAAELGRPVDRVGDRDRDTSGPNVVPLSEAARSDRRVARWLARSSER